MQKRIIKARDVMHSEHLELDGLATVEEALNAMKVANASVVIVKKRHEHDAYGILLLSDIAKKVLAKDRAAGRVNVYEIMSKPVICIASDMQARYAVRLLVQFNLSRALVVDRNRHPVGIVTLRDLLLRQPAPPATLST